MRHNEAAERKSGRFRRPWSTLEFYVSNELCHEKGGQRARQRATKLHDAAGLRAAERGVEAVAGYRTAGARQGRLVGCVQRRPLRKRRLHLRKEAAARDRPSYPLSDETP